MVTQPLQTLLLKVIPQKHQWKLSIHTHWDHIIGSLKDKVILEKITEDSLILLVYTCNGGKI